MGRGRRTLNRDPPIRRGRRGIIIPSLDPITRRRGRGLSDLPRRPTLVRPRPRVGARPVFQQAIPIRAGARGRRPVREGQLGRITSVRRAKPLPRPLVRRAKFGGDFDVLQPLGRPRPTRVEVAQPSGREGRLITVSSRSILARGRKKKKGRRRKTPKAPPRRAPRVPQRVASPFIPFQEISFGEGRRRPQTTPFTTFGGRTATVGARGARGRPIRRREEEEEERPRRRAPPRRRSQVQSDFDLGNIFDIQF